MLRISRLTDYAVVLCTELTRRTSAVSVTELSEATDIPAPTVAKVLKALTRQGVVVSLRGARGGYRLASEPTAIPIVRVIEALEGPIAVTECSDADATCEHEGSCGVRANWQRINRAVYEALATISLAEMTSPSRDSLVPLLRSRSEAEQARTAGRRR